MMPIFNFINDIMCYKKGNSLTIDNENEFSDYMVKRWISMSSCINSQDINKYANRIYNFFDKQELYKYLLLIIRKKCYRRINYLRKKERTEKNKVNRDYINFIANNMELGSRDIEIMKEKITGEKNEN